MTLFALAQLRAPYVGKYTMESLWPSLVLPLSKRDLTRQRPFQAQWNADHSLVLEHRNHTFGSGLAQSRGHCVRHFHDSCHCYDRGTGEALTEMVWRSSESLFVIEREG